MEQNKNTNSRTKIHPIHLKYLYAPQHTIYISAGSNTICCVSIDFFSLLSFFKIYSVWCMNMNEKHHKQCRTKSVTTTFLYLFSSWNSIFYPVFVYTIYICVFVLRRWSGGNLLCTSTSPVLICSLHTLGTFYIHSASNILKVCSHKI